MSQTNKPLNEGLRDAAAVHAKKRSSGIVLAIETAMKAIDEEMAEHDNIYPHHGGKLNRRELCRRACKCFLLKRLALSLEKKLSIAAVSQQLPRGSCCKQCRAIQVAAGSPRW